MVKKIFVTMLLASLVVGCGGQSSDSSAGIQSTKKMGAPVLLQPNVLGQNAVVDGSVVKFLGLRSNYVFKPIANGYNITDTTGVDGSKDYLLPINYFEFADSAISFDVDGNAGKAYRLYPAAFNRSPDLAGLGYQIKLLNSGVALETVANNFLTSPESVTVFGTNPDDTSFLTTLYNNTLHRAPDQAGLNYWLSVLNSGVSRAAVLVSFSESVEHKQSIAPLIANGVQYIPYPTPSGATSVTVGFNHSCAVTGSGGVKCWGLNNSGQLGNGTNKNSSVPVDVVGLNNVKSVSAGGAFNCALTYDGVVKCWGYGGKGQLGNNGIADSYVPVPIYMGTNPAKMVALAAGDNHVCAISTAGDVYCWGDNYYGQLASFVGAQSAKPISIAADSVGNALTGIQKISGGATHTCLLTSLGKVRCFGANDVGQLGTGNKNSYKYAVDVLGLSSGYVDVVAGYQHGCAISANGTAKCWGYIQSWSSSTFAPYDVAGISAATSFGKSIGSSKAICTFTRNAGPNQCWGANGNGQLGNGTTTFSTTSPTTVASDGLTLVSYAAGTSHTCAVAQGGKVLCWGVNLYGQLGNGTATGTTTNNLVKQYVIGF